MRPLTKGERIVTYPYLPTAAAWTYAMPHGEVLKVVYHVVTVTLDDGTIRVTDEANVRREKGWRQPVHRRLTQKSAPLPLDPEWEQPELPVA